MVLPPRTLTPNPTSHKHTSTNGRGTSASNSNAYLNSSVSSIAASTSRGPSPNKRQKSKTQSWSKARIPADSRAKLKFESNPKSSNVRIRDALSDTQGRGLDLGRDTSAEDPKPDQNVNEHVGDSAEDDETEGEAETDQDTEAEADIAIDADASHRTSNVDPFSAEEERIITVLSRKLEQLRESETTLSPTEASSPLAQLPASSAVDSNLKVLNKHGQRQKLGTLAAGSVAAPRPSDDGRRSDSCLAPQHATAVGKEKTSSHKYNQKRSSPPIATTIARTFDRGAAKSYVTADVPSREDTHSPISVVDSGIYPSSPSPTPSSPSSVYAAGAVSPIHYRNNSATNAKTDGQAIQRNSSAVPIAVNGTSNGHMKGKGKHLDDGSGVGDGIPIEFNNAYNHTYGAHISTLSSPEMSLSASPCEPYHPNGIGFAPANGHRSLANSKVRFDGLHAGQVPNQEQESEQTQQMLGALMQENEHLKSRIADMEGNFLRLANLNEAYREELIVYRRRLGLPVDNLIGLASDPLPRVTSTSIYAHTQGPRTYQHHHQPSSPLGNGFNNHSFNSYSAYNGNNDNINGNTNSHNAYQYHHSYHASTAPSPSNSTSMLNLPLSALAHNENHRTGGSYVPNRNDYVPNGFGYENGVPKNGFGTTSTNGVPIPRPPSQVHTNRREVLPMPMSVPNADNPLAHMHNSTSRAINEPQILSTSASSVPSPSYSSPPYSANSTTFFSPPYPSSYSATSSSAASSSAASSASTNVTSPPSSLSFTMMMMMPPTLGVPSRGLTYPLVPPPSLSSSVGSGSGIWEGGNASGNLSPVEPSGSSAVSRRESNAGMSVGRRGSVSSLGAAGGSVRRSRGTSLNHGPGQVARP